MFANCSSLTEVVVPDWITYIGTNCFSFCTVLEHLVFLNPALEVGGYMIQDCPQLVTAGPLGGVDSEKYRFNLEYAWTKEIPAYAFATGQGQSNLLEIVLPDGLTTLGAYALQNTAINSIKLPASLTTIKEGAFVYSNLTTISIPVGVTTIERIVFSGCTGLSNVVLYNTASDYKVNSAADSWFSKSNMNLVIKIPNSILERAYEYYGPYWNYFSDTLLLGYVGIEE